MSDSEQLTKAEAHTQAQKERILGAAQSCFVKQGFHAASMATIAETAEMSPGLIYRYFDSKNAIILAIIELQLQEARRRIRELHASQDLVGGLLGHFEECDISDESAMSAALFLEMSAQATRDPQIAEALSRFDAAVRAEIADWLGRAREDGGHGLPPEVTPARALMLVCIIEGLKVRGAREPLLDRTLLAAALNDIVPNLVAASS